jgi:hypothetical protein
MTDVAPPASSPSVTARTMPVLSVTVRLNTEFAQRVYRRCFDRLKGDLYVLTVRTYAGGMDEAARAIETTLSEAFDTVRKDLDSELERTDVLLDHLKMQDLAEYEGAQPIKAMYSTPRAKEFLDLLCKMDQLLMRYDALWLSGNIEPKQRWTRCQNWQRRLTKVANRLRELGNRTRAGLTREAEKRAQGVSPAVSNPASDAGSSEPTQASSDAEDSDEETVGAAAGPDELPEEFRGPADLIAASENGAATESQPDTVVAVTVSEPDSAARPATRRRASRVAEAANG